MIRNFTSKDPRKANCGELTELEHFNSNSQTPSVTCLSIDKSKYMSNENLTKTVFKGAVPVHQRCRQDFTIKHVGSFNEACESQDVMSILTEELFDELSIENEEYSKLTRKVDQKFSPVDKSPDIGSLSALNIIKQITHKSK